MRRDLSRACSSCRLRFSVALLACPACGRKALSVPEAIARVEAPPRAAWLAKWAIVLVLVPALGLAAWTGLRMLADSFPPHNALDVPVFFLSAVGAYLGASIVLAVPVWLWIKFIALLRWIFGRFVDRMANPLRVTLDRASRREPRARASLDWRGKLQQLRERLFPADRPRRIWIVGAAAVLGAQLLVEIFGRGRSLDFSGLKAFGESLVLLFAVNGGCLMVGLFMVNVLRFILGWSLGHLQGPPSLLGFEQKPPALEDALVARWREGREEVTGRAEPLTDEERRALAGHGRSGIGPQENAAEREELAAPFTGRRCFAFRVAGETDAQPLDDADAVSFAVVTLNGRRVAVHAADVVVLWPARGEVYREGAAEFLEVRGLPRRNVAAREGRIAEGERVRVLGHLARVAMAGGGYRAQKQLEILDAGDSQPVLIDAPTDG